MRITGLMVTNQVLNDINDAQNRLDVTQEQLSSGKKITQPSDDPYGASQAVDLNGQLGALTSYSSNVTDGTSWTQATDSALSSITNEVQRIRELVVEAANGTNSQSNLDSINAEISQLTASIKQDANSQYNGQYLFAGSATATVPYTTASDAYQGNGGTVTRVIGPGTTVQVNADLHSVLGDGQSSSDGKLLATLADISQHLTSGDQTSLGTTDLSGLDANLSTLEQVQTTNGAAGDRLQLASTRIASLQTSTTSALSNVQDADYATTMTNFTNEESAFTAALKASANIVQSSLMDFLQ